MDTDDADPWTVLASVRACAISWQPDARIIGNVRAGDIARAIQAIAERHYPGDRADGAPADVDGGWAQG